MKRVVQFLICVIISSAAVMAADGGDVLSCAREMHDAGKYAESIQQLDSYIHDQTTSSTYADSIRLVPYLYLQGMNYMSLGLTARAAGILNDALRLSERTADYNSTADICNSLFKLYFQTGNVQSGSGFLDQALNLYKKTHNLTGERNVLNNLGLLYYSKGDYACSESYFDKALDISDGDSLAIGQIYINKAELSYIRENLPLANCQLDTALAYFNHCMASSVGMQAWLNKALVLSRLGQSDNARVMLKHIVGGISLREPERMADTYAQLAEIQLIMGDSIEALRYVLQSQAITDSINRSKTNDQVHQLLVFYDTERITRQNKELEDNVRKRNLIIVLTTIVSVLVIVWIIYLVVRRRIDRCKNRLIRLQRERLMEFERKEHERKETEYRQQLDYKNRQLTSFSIDAANIGELHKKLFDSFERLRRNADMESRHAIEENINLLKNFNRSEVSEDFRVYFNEVHPDFTRCLTEQFPNLTPTDIRLCSYLYLGMTTKEIAALTFREIRSVESSRLRLRKKLGISGSQSLYDFLHILTN